MPPRWNENRLTAKFGIDYPVIQGPLGGLSSQKLTATDVSSFLTALVEEISEIAGPIIQWSAARRKKEILKFK